MSPWNVQQIEVLKTADVTSHMHSTWLETGELESNFHRECLEPVLDVVATTTPILFALM